MANAVKTKPFRNGGSQAVRLPKEMRFDTAEVRLTKVGKSVLIEPVEADEWAWLNELQRLRDEAGPFPDCDGDEPLLDLDPDVANAFK
jgi:virulence-associated protein VagC